jgi:hypothetical protein
MRGHWFLRALRFLLFAAVFIAVFGFVVMGLWNWLLPALFGWHHIDYWQALGILVLSKILFSGFRGGPGRNWGWRGRMMDRWEKMTPEEREKFRQGLRGRCGGFGRSEAETKAPTA